MVEQHDPAHAGVKAGRVVGALTAVLVVVSLLSVQDTFVGRLETVIQLFGIDPGPSVTVYFYLYLAGAVIARYALGYVVGSLIGVLYDWLDNPSAVVLVGIVLVVGLVDGSVAGLDTRSTLTALAYVAAWLCYVPAFYWLFDPTVSGQQGPRRLGDN